MQLEDYNQVYKLWSGIKGFGIRSLDDSREGIEIFLKRNPHTSVVAEDNGKIIGSILCGHDGRRGSMYHVCVDQTYRKLGVGHQMVLEALNRLRDEGINKVSLIAFGANAAGNEFWNKIGWSYRDDLNYYDYNLNEENITRFIK
jgi:ribosomal protein S18 acetylase RimI-like enzyme